MIIRPPKKKALLIGIGYVNNDELSLCGPHKDTGELKKLLQEVYGYMEESIVVMLDGKGQDNLEPTKDNILREIKNLVQDARPGDRFCFYYSGHTEQITNQDHTEEDSLDEVLLSCDQKMIVDDQLRKYLVDPLPIGSSLVAIFDTCHSATILDLEHYRCNRVYTPWKFKGKRPGSDPIRAGIVRQLALASGSLRIYENRRLSVDTLETRKTSIVLPQSGSTSIQRGSSSYQSKEAWFDAAGSIGVLLLQTKSKSKSISMTTEVFYDALESPYVSQVLQDDRSSSDGSFSSVELPIPRCASPVGYCSGFCMPTAEEKPNIICLSACKDYQTSWEMEGRSMTTAMIESLTMNPHPPLDDLMKKISHYVYQLALERHEFSRNLRRRCKKSTVDRAIWQSIHEQGFDIENYQDPQVASLEPLDMHALFTL